MTQVLATSDFEVDFKDYTKGQVIDFADAGQITHLVARGVVNRRAVDVAAAVAAGATQLVHSAGTPASDGLVPMVVNERTRQFTTPAARDAARGAAPGSYADPNTIVLMGDSITNNSNVNNGLTGASNVTIQHQTSDTGWFTWFNIALGGGFRVVKNAARAGDTTGQMLERFDADVLSVDSAWVLIPASVNDRRLDGSADPGSQWSVDNITAMINKARAAGRNVLLAMAPPNNAINALGAGHIKVENLLRVNDWLRRYAEANAGVVCLDTFSPVYDPSTLCGTAAGNYVDNTHPGVIAAHRIGTAAARQVPGLVKPRHVLAALGDVASATNPQGNLVKFGAMSGVGGTKPNTYVVVGDVPDGWWLQENGAVANAAHTITFSRPERTDRNAPPWWRTVVAWTPAQNTVATFTHRLLTGSTLAIPPGFAAGDLIDCGIELQYSNVTNAGPLEVHFIARQGTTELGFASLTYNQSATTPTPAFAGPVWANGFPLPAGADNIFVRVVARNLAGTTGGYTLDMGDVSVRKRP